MKLTDSKSSVSLVTRLKPKRNDKLEQIEKEEKEFAHNLRGSKPSTFHDVEDGDLRAKNRGAILANIFERYTSKDTRGSEQLLAKDFSLMARELEVYLERLPKGDRGAANQCMRLHLQERGYAYAS